MEKTVSVLQCTLSLSICEFLNVLPISLISLNFLKFYTMRLLLLPQVSLLLLAYFQGSTGQSRQKRQFGMVNPNDDVPFNFGNSFDGSQATFERQKGRQ